MQPPLDRPVAIVIGVILAFILGNAFMLVANFVLLIENSLVSLVYSKFRRLWKALLQYLMSARGVPARTSRFAKFKIVRNAHRRMMTDYISVQRAGSNWQRVAMRIFNLYGIEPPRKEDSDSWVNWVGILGRFRKQDFRGPVLLMATQAIGWSGLAAMHFAPRLHITYFVAFCLFSIGISLFHGFRLALGLASPIRSWNLGLLRTFRELTEVAPIGKPEQDNDQDG